MRFVFCWLLALFGTLGFATVANAEHAFAMGYTPKYPAHFSHFSYVNPDAPKGGRLTLPASGGFDSLNPFTLKGAKEAGMTMLMFDTLGEKSWDEPFSVYGLLAKEMFLAADGLSVTFVLDPRARFSDGSPVTAADVKYSFDTLTKHPAAHPRYKVYWGDVDRAEVLSPQKIRFVFKRKNSELHLIIAELPVFSRKWGNGRDFGQIVKDPPLASGPYLLKQFDLGKQSTFQLRPDYWAKNLPVRKGQFNFAEIRFRYLLDDTVRLEAFKAGEFDVVAENMAKTWARSYQGHLFDQEKIIRRELPNSNPNGMQGFVMNLRRPLFKDRRVRQALALAFDFDWANRHLFFNQYRRSTSFFSNSELAATGMPSKAELSLLKPLEKQLPKEVFLAAPTLPATPNSELLRKNLINARDLLAQAGWTVKNGVLKNAQGQVFKIEFLVFSRTYERILAPYQHLLKKLGIQLEVRMVDSAIYQQRMDDFNFDMAVAVYGMSLSPGSEMQDYFSSTNADQAGSLNVAGLKSPAVDALLPHFTQSHDRQSLITAARALDRVLRAEYIVVPNWHLAVHRVAWWNRFGMPKTLPAYYQALDWVVHTWWAQPELKEAKP